MRINTIIFGGLLLFAPGGRAQNIDTLALDRAKIMAGEAVSTIDGRRLEDIPSSNFTQMLHGLLPGLGTLETSSDPGNSSVTKYVRGLSTVNGSAPMVVVDGIIMQSYNLDYLTAAEVESVSLLKDAAATAIYGMRGSNGVLSIKTRHAAPGSFDVRITADFSMQQLSRRPQSLSSLEYAGLRNQAWAGDGSPGNAPFSDYALSQLREGGNPLYPDNDYYKEFVRDFATMERVGVTMSGGTKRARVWSNINMMNQTSLLRQETEKYNSTPRRLWINFRAKVDVDISKNVRAFASVAGNVRNDRLGANAHTNASIYETIFQLPPTMIGPTTGDGRVTTMENVSMPTYGILNRSGYTKYTGMYAATHAGLTLKLDFITKGLEATAKVAFQSSNDRYNYSTQDFRRFYYSDTGEDFVQLGSNQDTSLQNSASGTFQYALSYIAQIDYHRSFGKNNLEAHLYSYFTEEQFNNASAAFPAVGFPWFNHNSGLNLSYDYGGRYLVGATLAISGSDNLPRKNRYAFLPSVSAAWVISSEEFMQGVSWLDLLKVRASYGHAGFDDFRIGEYRYLYADYILRSGEVRLQGNPDLKPELHKIQNYGIEIGLWNRLDLSFDYFRRRTDNMLIDSGNGIPSWQGIYVGNYMKVNEGAMRNSGFELSADYTQPIGRDWRINFGVDWSHATNTVVDAGEQPWPGATGSNSGFAYSRRVEGYPSGQAWGYLVDRSNGNGYISTAAELAAATAMYGEIGAPRPGDFLYRDLNDDGVVNQKDMAPIGKGSVPTDFTTFRLGFGWKGLEFEAMIQGVTGFWGRMAYDTDLAANGIYNDLHLGAWTPERAASGAKITAPALSYGTTSVSALDNDYYITDRSFWRMRNMSLSYTLPSRVLRGSGIGRLKIVLSGQNLFTLSAIDSKTIDPEKGSMTLLPAMRVVNLGVKIDF